MSTDCNADALTTTPSLIVICIGGILTKFYLFKAVVVTKCLSD